MVRLVSAAGVLSLVFAVAAQGNPPAPAGRAAILGGALPGGAVVSARSVILTPAAGGNSTAVPIAADGAFSATGLAPGHYTLRVSSITVPRQTQGATFGEKVNQGLHAAGGALASGAQAGAPASPGVSAPGADASASGQREKIIHRDLAARLSTNLTVGNQSPRAIDIDGDGVAVDALATGVIAGIVVATGQ